MGVIHLPQGVQKRNTQKFEQDSHKYLILELLEITRKEIYTNYNIRPIQDNEFRLQPMER